MSDPAEDLGEFLEEIGKVKVAPRKPPREMKTCYKLIPMAEGAPFKDGPDRIAIVLTRDLTLELIRTLCTILKDPPAVISIDLAGCLVVDPPTTEVR